MVTILCVILFVLMSVIGGDRGIKSFLALILNSIIAVVTIYFICSGVNAIAAMILSSALFSGVTLFYINEFSLKTVSSFLAVDIVVLLLSLLITYLAYNGQITGYNEIDMCEESIMFLSTDLHINIYQLIICTTIWGLLGAIIDTSISISSAVNEIITNNPHSSKRGIFKSSMSIGKDILGTMVNTLLFVAMGESIMLTLFYYKNQYSIEKILNSKSFIQEIATVFIPCMGCILIIPVTAEIFLFLRKSDKIINYFKKKAEKTASETLPPAS